MNSDRTAGPAPGEEPRGRLFLVTAPAAEPAAAVASAVAERLARCVLVTGSAVDAMVVSGGVGGSQLERMQHLLLRWSACLALAETYLLEGYDAVVTDVVTGPHVEDFLDLAAPETVHLLVLDEAQSSTTPRWGLWLSPGTAAPEAADALLGALEEAAVLTAGPEDDAGAHS